MLILGIETATSRVSVAIGDADVNYQCAGMEHVPLDEPSGACSGDHYLRPCNFSGKVEGAPVTDGDRAVLAHQ